MLMLHKLRLFKYKIATIHFKIVTFQPYAVPEN